MLRWPILRCQVRNQGEFAQHAQCLVPLRACTTLFLDCECFYLTILVDVQPLIIENDRVTSRDDIDC